MRRIICRMGLRSRLRIRYRATAVVSVDRGGCGSRLDGALHRDDQAIAAPRQRLDVTWVICRVAQGLAKSRYARVHSVFEVDEGVARPKFAAQLVARDDLTRPFQQHGQNLKGLLLQANPRAGSA